MRAVLLFCCWSLLIAMALCFSTVHASEMLRVGIIDTGLDVYDARFTGHICTQGSRDFTGEGLQDDKGHGTHVAGLIMKYAKDSNYCLVVLKFLKKNDEAGFIEAPIREAVAQHLDVVNLSVNGGDFEEDEKAAICQHPSTLFIIAAGNDGVNLDEHPIYPQYYGCKNETIVGGKDYIGSNYGALVTAWENAVNILSTLPNGAMGYLTGTSMSTAIKTGKVVYEKSHH